MANAFHLCFKWKKSQDFANNRASTGWKPRKVVREPDRRYITEKLLQWRKTHQKPKQKTNKINIGCDVIFQRSIIIFLDFAILFCLFIFRGSGEKEEEDHLHRSPLFKQHPVLNSETLPYSTFVLFYSSIKQPPALNGHYVCVHWVAV